MVNKLKLITNNCPACGEPMVPDKYDFYTCIGCGGQFCPPDESDKAAHKVILECARNDYVSKAVMHVKSKVCGSKSCKSHGKDQKMGKPTTRQLYDTLSNGRV